VEKLTIRKAPALKQRSPKQDTMKREGGKDRVKRILIFQELQRRRGERSKGMEEWIFYRGKDKKK